MFECRETEQSRMEQRLGMEKVTSLAMRNDASLTEQSRMEQRLGMEEVMSLAMTNDAPLYDTRQN